MEKWERGIFFENKEMPELDVSLFDNMPVEGCSDAERNFFAKMKVKETGEFAPSADLIIDEDSNNDRVFLVRYYFTEYKIGKRGVVLEWPIYHDTLSEMLDEDLFPLLGRHVNLHDWLREQSFACVRYNGNFALK